MLDFRETTVYYINDMNDTRGNLFFIDNFKFKTYSSCWFGYYDEYLPHFFIAFGYSVIRYISYYRFSPSSFARWCVITKWFWLYSVQCTYLCTHFYIVGARIFSPKRKRKQFTRAMQVQCHCSITALQYAFTLYTYHTCLNTVAILNGQTFGKTRFTRLDFNTTTVDPRSTRFTLSKNYVSVTNYKVATVQYAYNVMCIPI